MFRNEDSDWRLLNRDPVGPADIHRIRAELEWTSCRMHVLHNQCASVGYIIQDATVVRLQRLIDVVCTNSGDDCREAIQIPECNIRGSEYLDRDAYQFQRFGNFVSGTGYIPNSQFGCRFQVEYLDIGLCRLRNR